MNSRTLGETHVWYTTRVLYVQGATFVESQFGTCQFEISFLRLFREEEEKEKEKIKKTRTFENAFYEREIVINLS